MSKKLLNEKGSPRFDLLRLFKVGEAGLTPILILVLLVGGLAAGLYAFNYARTVIKPKAYDPSESVIRGENLVPALLSYGARCSSSPECQSELSCVSGVCKYPDKSQYYSHYCGADSECQDDLNAGRKVALSCIGTNNSSSQDMEFINTYPDANNVSSDIGLTSEGRGKCVMVREQKEGYSCLHNIECQQGLICGYIKMGENRGAARCMKFEDLPN